MNILIVGGGGREHALAWKLAQAEYVRRIFVAPGNAGMAADEKLQSVAIAVEDVPALLDLARDRGIDLTIIGPEAPLVAGIVDAFAAAGLPCFGPSAAAAQLEGSKTFAKAFMQAHQIPTAPYADFADADAARRYIRKASPPLVIKADGLAAGKGVVVAETTAQAEAAAERLAASGQRLVIEQYLHGEEASFMVMSDGVTALPLASCQDHKARDAGDAGPNTGGMGACSPAPVVTAAVHEKIMRYIIAPAIAGMQAAGTPYVGFLYAGLMIDANDDPWALEFNCRLGDPETQPLMMRLRGDLAGLCLLALQGRLREASVAWDSQAAVGVVMAAAGYPDAPRRGDVISGLDSNLPPAVQLFHAGTKQAGSGGDAIITNGGRVLCATALGASVAAAARAAYQAAAQIHYEGMFYRPDIAHRAIRRERGAGPDLGPV